MIKQLYNRAIEYLLNLGFEIIKFKLQLLFISYRGAILREILLKEMVGFQCQVPS
jgi:hypothetical protein